MESVFINNTFILEKIYIFLIVGIRVPYKSLRSSLLIMLFKITYILSEFLNSWFNTYWAVLPLLWWTYYFILGRSVRFFFLVFWGNVIFVQVENGWIEPLYHCLSLIMLFYLKVNSSYPVLANHTSYFFGCYLCTI